jgi:membrane protease subunit (stomatin/prohibitin family)
MDGFAAQANGTEQDNRIRSCLVREVPDGHYAASVIFSAENIMSFGSFLGKQFIAVIEWNEPADGILSYRYPMRDLEIENGGQLTVSESQVAAFVNEGKIADVFGPGLHTLNTRNLPLLTDLKNWDKAFESPFKSEVYFFSTRLQIDQKWGTATPITIRDKEFGAVRLRCYGIYSYRISDPRIFFNQISGTRDSYLAAELEGQLRESIVGSMTEAFASSDISFIDMAANHTILGEKVAAQVKPAFTALGLELDKFVVENVSLPEELQKVFDQRIGMNMVGDLGRYTLYAAAESLDLSAANTSGAAGMGMGLGAGAAVAQVLQNALKPSMMTPGGVAPQQPAPVLIGASGGDAAAAGASKFCIECGKSIPQLAKFCPDCGKQQ